MCTRPRLAPRSQTRPIRAAARRKPLARPLANPVTAGAACKCLKLVTPTFIFGGRPGSATSLDGASQDQGDGGGGGRGKDGGVELGGPPAGAATIPPAGRGRRRLTRKMRMPARRRIATPPTTSRDPVEGEPPWRPPRPRYAGSRRCGTMLRTADGPPSAAPATQGSFN
jgi:hypothetical protein